MVAGWLFGSSFAIHLYFVWYVQRSMLISICIFRTHKKLLLVILRFTFLYFCSLSLFSICCFCVCVCISFYFTRMNEAKWNSKHLQKKPHDDPINTDQAWINIMTCYHSLIYDLAILKNMFFLKRCLSSMSMKWAHCLFMKN